MYVCNTHTSWFELLFLIPKSVITNIITLTDYQLWWSKYFIALVLRISSKFTRDENFSLGFPISITLTALNAHKIQSFWERIHSRMTINGALFLLSNLCSVSTCSFKISFHINGLVCHYFNLFLRPWFHGLLLASRYIYSNATFMLFCNSSGAY